MLPEDRRHAGIYRIPFPTAGLAAGTCFYRLRVGSTVADGAMTVVAP
jgi:hypothetical protein